MTTYISEPIPVDRASIKTQMQDAWTALDPGIDFAAGTPADFLLDVFAQMHAESLQTLTQMLEIAFRGSLEKVDRVFQRDAVQATTDATLTRTDTAARTVPAGTEFNLQGADGNPVAFQLVNDAVFASLDTSEAVELIAVQGGAGGNGLSVVLGPALTSTWYANLVVTGSTSGGEDGETDDEYLNRAADTRPGRAFTIVLPEDLSRFLRNETGVDRVLVLDRYNPVGPSFDDLGHVTAIPIDAAGAALSGGTMTDLQEAAQEIALNNLQVHVIAPTKVDVDVVFVGVASAGYDATDVNDRAESAVLDFLDGSRWGLPDGGDQRDWIETTIVRHQDIGTILNNVQGFDHWTTLTINGSATDFTLTGPGALPDVDSTCSGTTT